MLLYNFLPEIDLDLFCYIFLLLTSWHTISQRHSQLSCLPHSLVGLKCITIDFAPLQLVIHQACWKRQLHSMKHPGSAFSEALHFTAAASQIILVPNLMNVVGRNIRSPFHVVQMPPKPIPISGASSRLFRHWTTQTLTGGKINNRSIEF
jgi:hypothetical protein